MSADFLNTALVTSTTPTDEICELYAAKIRKSMVSMGVCLEWRTFMTLFWLLAFTLELTEDVDKLADIIQRSLCLEVETAATLGAKISKSHNEIKARKDPSLTQKERSFLEKHRKNKHIEELDPNRLLNSVCSQAIDTIADSLVEVSFSSITTFSSRNQSQEEYNTLWILPHIMTPEFRDGLLTDLSVFAEHIYLSEFTLGKPDRNIKGFVARFPTVYATCLCAYSICQRNFLVGATLSSSNVYVYSRASTHTLRTISDYVETTPDISDIEFSNSSDENSNTTKEPIIKKLQNSMVIAPSSSSSNLSESISYQSQDSESEGIPHFDNPDCVVKLTNIPKNYRGVGFKQLKILKGKTPPKRVLHGDDEAGLYTMYIEFEHTTPLQKFIDACKNSYNKNIKIQAIQGDVPSDYSGLEDLEPREIWYNRNAAPVDEKKDIDADYLTKGPVVKVVNLPEIYRDLTRSEEFWCGENRPLLWWSLLSKVLQDAKNKGVFYFCFKYRVGEEVKSVKWFKKSLIKALHEQDIQNVSINILTELPVTARFNSVEIPASKL